MTAQGYLATSSDADDAYLASEIAQIILVHPGERQLVPAFGINDPAFDVLDTSDVAVQADMWKVPVTIQSVTQRFVSDTESDVQVQFSSGRNPANPNNRE